MCRDSLVGTFQLIYADVDRINIASAHATHKDRYEKCGQGFLFAKDLLLIWRSQGRPYVALFNSLDKVIERSRS